VSEATAVAEPKRWRVILKTAPRVVIGEDLRLEEGWVKLTVNGAEQGYPSSMVESYTQIDA
jgi:hypothetical protein